MTTANLIDSIGHLVIVVLVIGAATYLAATGHIARADVMVIFGTALGFTGGAVATRAAIRRTTEREETRNGKPGL